MVREIWRGRVRPKLRYVIHKVWDDGAVERTDHEYETADIAATAVELLMVGMFLHNVREERTVAALLVWDDEADELVKQVTIDTPRPGSVFY